MSFTVDELDLFFENSTLPLDFESGFIKTVFFLTFSHHDSPFKEILAREIFSYES